MAKKTEAVPRSSLAYPAPPGFNGKLLGLYRWFSGRPLNGHRYTDATGFRYGTMATDISGQATTFQLMPGYKRFLYARLPIMVAPALGIAVMAEPEKGILAGVGVATLAAKELDAYRKVRGFRRQTIEPVAAGLSRVMNERHVRGHGYRWVDIPRDFRDSDEAAITVRLPMGWEGAEGDKARMAKVVATRLNLDEVTATWKWELGVHSVTFRTPPSPPAALSFQNGLALLEGAGEEEVVLGAGPRGKRVVFSLGLDSPHALFAAGSGAGKSELLAYIIGQFMRRGYGVMVLDGKFISHMWLRRVPGVAYLAEAEEMHHGLMWLDNEVMRRARFVAMGGDPATLEPIVAILEEMTAARNRLDTYWKATKDTGQPALSPALAAMTNVASMGRELRVHIFMAGQSITAKVTGGPEGRENFAGRGLARATANQWKMLAPQIKPAPTTRRAPGRWHFVVGDTLLDFQSPFMDLKGKTTGGEAAAEARIVEWATGGLQGPDVAALVEAYAQDHVFLEGGEGGTNDGTNASSEPTTPRGISLREYAEQSGVELRTLTRWRERRSDFPTFVAIAGRNTHLFDPDHLKDYVRTRLREPVNAESE